MSHVLAIARRPRILLAVLCCVAPAVRAQGGGHVQILSISVGADQALTYPSAAPASPFLEEFPDEHMTFLPPSSPTTPYLLFGASALSTGANPGQAIVLESSDLKTFTFAQDQGYSPLIMQVALFMGCSNGAAQKQFDVDYAGPGYVAQDPTLPAGNLIMLYEAENHCTSGSFNANDGYASVGLARSSDNGKTWPAPINDLTGGANRYPVLQTVTSPPTTAALMAGNLSESGFIDKSVDGNYYLYSTYQLFAPAGNGPRIARAKLGVPEPLTFQKWSNGSFSQPGIGGSDSAGWLSTSCGYAGMHAISYIDPIGLYLLTFVCTVYNGSTPISAAWYWASATSLDLENWTAPQMIQNSEFPITICSNGANSFDGFYPSFMSLNSQPAHIGLTGTVFFLQGCQAGINSTMVPRAFASRTFTIATQGINACDLQNNGNIGVTDVQLMINQALGETKPMNDLNADSSVNVVDVQLEVNAALTGNCNTP